MPKVDFASETCPPGNTPWAAEGSRQAAVADGPGEDPIAAVCPVDRVETVGEEADPGGQRDGWRGEGARVETHGSQGAISSPTKTGLGFLKGGRKGWSAVHRVATVARHS